MLEDIKKQLPQYANDIKLNLSAVLEDSETDLTQHQILEIALASAYATKESKLIEVFEAYSSEHLDEDRINAAKAAATIMAMNNIYYRFVHLAKDDEMSRLPAKLRMNIIGNPGVDKIDFELMSLAVSAINGCGLCMDSHSKTLQKTGLRKIGIQHAVRIAAVVNAMAQVVIIDQL